jgi:hypothetical protein
VGAGAWSVKGEWRNPRERVLLRIEAIMDKHHEAQAARAGRAWAEQKADALEGTSAQDWPAEWDPRWAGELRLSGARVARRELEELIDFANREAAERWLELVETRRAVEDARGELEEIEARAVWLYEALRAHTPEGLTVGRDGARVYLQDMGDATELSVGSLGEASRVISDWQERHFGR